MSSAFGLRAEYEGTVDQDGEQVPAFTGGVLAIPDGRSYNVREELDKSGGTIVVPDDDHILATVLEQYPALKSVPVPDKKARKADTAGTTGKEA